MIDDILKQMNATQPVIKLLCKRANPQIGIRILNGTSPMQPLPGNFLSGQGFVQSSDPAGTLRDSRDLILIPRLRIPASLN